MQRFCFRRHNSLVLQYSPVIIRINIFSMEELHTEKKEHTEVTLRPHGPLVIKGNFEVVDEDGKTLEKKEQMSFCRCRLSQKWPFCDGSHKAIH